MPDNPSPPKQLTPKEFGDQIQKSTRTLRHWDRKNLFPARRTPGGDPYYLEEDVHRYFNGEYQLLRA